MERKTKKVDGVWTAPCKYGKFSYPVISQETIDRLAAYEDTGLEPEEVAAFDRLVALYVEAGLDKNFVLACIEATKAGMTIDRLRKLAEADREGRIQVKPKMLKCPRCGSTHLAQRVDGACYYCFDCGAHIVPNEVEATIATNKEEI